MSFAEKNEKTRTSEQSSEADIEQNEFAVERRKSTSDTFVELSGIEATAASQAAWLIAITVSIGNFLFGMRFVPAGSNGRLIRTQDMILVTSHQS